MAASTNLDNLGVQALRVADFKLGINTAIPPTEIQDNEVQDLLNFEFDDSGNISTRRGVTQLSSDTFSNRITSLHYFTVDAGEIGILLTEGTTLRIIETNGTGLTTLSGALTLPNNTFWQWVTFGGLAIGVNGATSGDNPVRVNAAAAAAALGGSPPRGKYIAVWNSRVWIASASAFSRIHGSALGLPEDWTATGASGAVTIDIDTNDGDPITGLFSTRDALYVFKRRSIHRIVAFADPNTDANNLRREVVTKDIGCAGPYSIQQIPNDVVFLSDQGIASLSLVQNAEDFRTAFYSRNVKELTNFPKTTLEIPSLFCDTGAQYWISLPTSVAPNGNKMVYVLDYLRIDEGIVRWARFDGMVAGTAFTSFPGASGKTYEIGALNSGGANYQLFTYVPRLTTALFSDTDSAARAYTKAIAMKSYNGNAQLLKKYWHEWGVGINLLSASAGVTVAYYFDQNINRGDSYSFGLTGVTTGALWAGGLWGAGLWGTTFSGKSDIVRELKSNSFGRESQDVTFNISNAQAGEGFTIQDFMLWFTTKNNKKVTDV